jgi:hypothetical protein
MVLKKMYLFTVFFIDIGFGGFKENKNNTTTYF